MLAQSTQRWEARREMPGKVLAAMSLYTSVDDASMRRVTTAMESLRLRERYLAERTNARGLPFTAPSNDSIRMDRLVQTADSVEGGKTRMRERIEATARQQDAAKEAERGHQRDLLRAELKRHLPEVSEPGKPTWEASSMKWAYDSERGEWVRTDVAWPRIPEPSQGARPGSYVVKDKDNIRTVVNQVLIPKRQMAKFPVSVSSRLRGSAEFGEVEHSSGTGPARSIKMGGGFAYRSSVAPDPQRPTPSRPAFSHGLFLFPFQSAEQAAQMMGDGEPIVPKRSTTPLGHPGRRPTRAELRARSAFKL
mmetsp:Transcript_3693/g.8420  ORF Transcript_3693/g.8420 Transcript_3693/m.8420 type:complete len:307 (+) Transcript_3693:3-923(+)